MRLWRKYLRENRRESNESSWKEVTEEAGNQRWIESGDGSETWKYEVYQIK